MLGNYRVKPIQVDAEQIVGRNVNVSTRRGLITARDGDWVIHDALGVAEVLDGDAFFRRYEMVPEEENVQAVERGTPDPNTPRDAPREDVQFPDHLQTHLTTGTPRAGEGELTDAEAQEAAKEPYEKPVVGSAFFVPERSEQRFPAQEMPRQEVPRQESPKQEAPKNKGGRPKGKGTGHHGH